MEFGSKHKSTVTLRSLVRLLDSSYLLMMEYPRKLDLHSSIWAAYRVTLERQLSVDGKLSNVVYEHLQRRDLLCGLLHLHPDQI